MNSKIFFYLILLGFGASILLTNAQVTTNLLFSDSDVLEAEYLVYYTVEIDQSDTTLRAQLSSTLIVDFVLYEDDEWEYYLDGGSNPSYLIYHTDVTIDTLTTTLDRGTYYLVIINWGSEDCTYDITVNEIYDTSFSFGDNMYILIGIGVAVFALIGIIAFARSRRQRAAPVHYQSQAPDVSQYQPIVQQPSEYLPPATEQSVFDARPKGLQICPNCGADEDITTKFCTNCGSKLGN